MGYQRFGTFYRRFFVFSGDSRNLSAFLKKVCSMCVKFCLLHTLNKRFPFFEKEGVRNNDQPRDC